MYLVYTLNLSIILCFIKRTTVFFMKLYIKNMVCPRCIMAVKDILIRQGICLLDVRLGEVILAQELNKSQTEAFRSELESIGFELLDDNQQQLIEQIKALIINYIHFAGESESNISEILTRELHKDYSALSKLFSATEGITIEHYAILQKIEKVKELLTYNRQTLSEIAYALGYSSVAHLSSQFKKVTGLTPTDFRSQGIGLRKSLDKI